MHCRSMSLKKDVPTMRNSIVLGIVATLIFAGYCSAEEYILKIEEVEGPPPQIKHMEGSPTTGYGWLEVTDTVADRIHIAKCTELLVSTDSKFYLKINNRSNIVELDGRLQKSDGVSFSQVGILTESQQPPHIVTIEQGQDFLIQVEYRCEREDGHQAAMLSPSIPIRFGKKYCMVGLGMVGGRYAIPPMLWSLEKVNTKSDK